MNGLVRAAAALLIAFTASAAETVDAFKLALEEQRTVGALDLFEALLFEKSDAALAAVVEATTHENVWIRRAAIRGMSVRGGEKALDVFVTALKDANALVRLDACQLAPRFAALDAEKVATGLVDVLLRDRSRGVRRAAAGSLGQLAREESAYAVDSAAREDASPDVRQAALDAAVSIRREGAYSLMIQALLGDPDSRVRATAAAGLGRLGLEVAAGPLQAGMRDMDARVRVASARSLGNIRNDHAVEILRFGYALDDPDLYREIGYALGNIGTPKAIKELRDALQHPSDNARRPAVEALGMLGDVESGPILIRMAEDFSPAIRAAVATALANIGDPRGQQAVRRLLSDRTAEVRIRAAEAAGRMADTLLIPNLVAMTWTEYEPEERAAAAEALGRMGDPRAHEMLTDLLVDPTEVVRRAAASALGRLGLGGEALLGVESYFVDDARLEFLVSLALTRTPKAEDFFRRELRHQRRGSTAAFACEIGLYLLGDEDRRQAAVRGALGEVQGAHPMLAVAALILKPDAQAREITERAAASPNPGVRANAAMALEFARPRWARPILEKMAGDSEVAVALKARSALMALMLAPPASQK